MHRRRFRRRDGPQGQSQPIRSAINSGTPERRRPRATSTSLPPSLKSVTLLRSQEPSELGMLILARSFDTPRDARRNRRRVWSPDLKSVPAPRWIRRMPTRTGNQLCYVANGFERALREKTSESPSCSRRSMRSARRQLGTSRSLRWPLRSFSRLVPSYSRSPKASERPDHLLDENGRAAERALCDLRQAADKFTDAHVRGLEHHGTSDLGDKVVDGLGKVKYLGARNFFFTRAGGDPRTRHPETRARARCLRWWQPLRFAWLKPT